MLSKLKYRDGKHVVLELDMKGIEKLANDIADGSDFEHAWWLAEKLEQMGEAINEELEKYLVIKKELDQDESENADDKGADDNA